MHAVYAHGGRDIRDRQAWVLAERDQLELLLAGDNCLLPFHLVLQPLPAGICDLARPAAKTDQPSRSRRSAIADPSRPVPPVTNARMNES